MSARWGLRPVLRVLTLNKHRRRSQQQSSWNCNVKAWKKPQQQLQQYYKQHSHSHTRAITYNARTDRHTLIHRTSLSDHVGSEDVRFKNCNNNSKCRHNNNNNNNNGCKSREEEEQQQQQQQQQKPRRQREKPEKRHSFFCFCLKRTSAAAQWRIVIE